jgi:hypothetical protein
MFTTWTTHELKKARVSSGQRWLPLSAYLQTVGLSFHRSSGQPQHIEVHGPRIPPWMAFASSESGYTDSRVNLNWVKKCSTGESETTYLICDGFGTHESLEVTTTSSFAVFLRRLPVSSSPVTSECLAHPRLHIVNRLNGCIEKVQMQSDSSI